MLQLDRSVKMRLFCKFVLTVPIKNQLNSLPIDEVGNQDMLSSKFAHEAMEKIHYDGKAKADGK